MDRVEIPAVRFCEEITQFVNHVAKEKWKKLAIKDQIFISNITVKLEPIIQIVPAIATQAVLGFEALALGPDGQNFPEIEKQTKEFDAGLVRLILTIAAMKTAEILKNNAIYEGQSEVHNLLITVNLDPVMLVSEYLQTFMDVYSTTGLSNVIFEINESISCQHINLLKKLFLRHGVKFALDDVNAMSNEVKELLADKAVLTKVDYKTFSEAMKNVWSDKRETVGGISKYKINEKPLVV